MESFFGNLKTEAEITEEAKEAKRAKEVEKPEPKKRKKRASKIIKPTEPQEFEQIVNGEKLIFVLKDGGLKLKEHIKRAERKERFFRLKPMPTRVQAYQQSRRYFYNPGPGKKVLRFWQKNFDGAERDPKKENILKVEDRETILALASMPSVFEEVELDDNDTTK